MRVRNRILSPSMVVVVVDVAEELVVDVPVVLDVPDCGVSRSVVCRN